MCFTNVFFSVFVCFIVVCCELLVFAVPYYRFSWVSFPCFPCVLVRSLVHPVFLSVITLLLCCNRFLSNFFFVLFYYLNKNMATFKGSFCFCNNNNFVDLITISQLISLK